MESYPVLRITHEQDGCQITIEPDKPPDNSNVGIFMLDGWEIQYLPGVQRDTATPSSLVYCPNASPDLSHLQFSEQSTYILHIKGVARRQFCALCSGQDIFLCYASADDSQFSGTLNWGNYVGASNITFTLGNGQIALPIEVRSKKMGYLDDYQQMLNDLSERLSALIFSFNSPAAVYQQHEIFDRRVLYLDYLFIRHLMQCDRLPLHFALIEADPHRALIREPLWEELSQAHSLGPRTVESIFSHPEHLVRSQRLVAPALQARTNGLLPIRLLDQHAVATFDTPPNRFVKHFLGELILKLRRMEDAFRETAPHLLKDCCDWRRELENHQRAPFLEQVGPMHIYPAGSQVLLKREGYRELNDYYRLFLLTSKVRWDGFEKLIRTPNKDLATLYEYWCFFQILDAVSAALGVEVSTQDVVVLEGGVFQVNLSQSGSTKAMLGQCKLYYNQYYRHGNRSSNKSYSVALHPDFTLELGDRILVFDAKYRYDNRQIGEIFKTPDSAEKEREEAAAEESAEEQGKTFKRGDLYKMHTYRDAIKGAKSAFILYPGNELDGFRVDGAHLKEIAQITPEFEGVGAIPLTVKNQDVLRQVVRRLIVQEAT
jgi:hypothetical protein